MSRARGKSAPVLETAKDYARLPYRLEIIPDDGGFVVRYPELPGCITQVEQFEDVLPTAREILEGWLELALEDDQTIPSPGGNGRRSSNS